MADQTLLMLAQDVRGKTLRILDAVTDDQAIAVTVTRAGVSIYRELPAEAVTLARSGW